jgi:hypothetical protein
MHLFFEQPYRQRIGCLDHKRDNFLSQRDKVFHLEGSSRRSIQETGGSVQWASMLVGTLLVHFNVQPSVEITTYMPTLRSPIHICDFR